jgi:hypothetical protein
MEPGEHRAVPLDERGDERPQGVSLVVGRAEDRLDFPDPLAARLWLLKGDLPAGATELENIPLMLGASVALGEKRLDEGDELLTQAAELFSSGERA